MRRGKNKEDLIVLLKEFIPELNKDQNHVEELISHLKKKHHFTSGKVSYYLNNPERFNDADIEVIGLFADQISLKLEDAKELALENWFLGAEMKNIRGYILENKNSDSIEFPLTFENAVDLGDGVYLAAVDYATIARLYKHGKTQYNFEIQRAGIVKKIGDEFVKEMEIYTKNVAEIKQRVLQRKLKKTAIAYNCRVGSTEDESEYELFFDDEENTLTITKGTIVEILDGTHRTLGIYEAYQEDSDLKGKMPVLFSNYTESQAKEYQVELAKATPFNKIRARQLEEKDLSDELVNRLNSEGSLKNLISPSNVIRKELNYVTSFELLANAFKWSWNPSKRSEITKIINYFNEYLEILFDEFEDETKDVNSLLFNKVVFCGNVPIAKKMHDNNIPLDKLPEIIRSIDFEPTSELGKIAEITELKSRSKKINKYFEKIDLTNWEGVK